jgi:hypothetical protein
LSETENKGGADSFMVGGNHYRKIEGEQHWTRQWRTQGPGYFIGCITAYVERYQDKDGIKDLLKAKHFIEKLIELETAYANGIGVPPGNGRAPLKVEMAPQEGKEK